MLNVGEEIHVVWEKRPNVESFGAATAADASSLRLLEISSSVSCSNDGERDDQSKSMSQSGTYNSLPNENAYG